MSDFWRILAPALPVAPNPENADDSSRTRPDLDAFASPLVANLNHDETPGTRAVQVEEVTPMRNPSWRIIALPPPGAPNPSSKTRLVALMSSLEAGHEMLETAAQAEGVTPIEISDDAEDASAFALDTSPKKTRAARARGKVKVPPGSILLEWKTITEAKKWRKQEEASQGIMLRNAGKEKRNLGVDWVVKYYYHCSRGRHKRVRTGIKWEKDKADLNLTDCECRLTLVVYPGKVVGVYVPIHDHEIGEENVPFCSIFRTSRYKSRKNASKGSQPQRVLGEAESPQHKVISSAEINRARHRLGKEAAKIPDEDDMEHLNGE